MRIPTQKMFTGDCCTSAECNSRHLYICWNVYFLTMKIKSLKRFTIKTKYLKTFRIFYVYYLGTMVCGTLEYLLTASLLFECFTLIR
jgi:hypothetical protein